MSNSEIKPLVDADWLKARLGQPGLVVLDVRTPPKGGFIPGSVHSDYATAGWRATVGSAPGLLPEPAVLERLIGGLGIGDGDHVVVVSAGDGAGDVSNAARVYWTLRMAGHDSVSLLDGGFAAWVAAGGAVEAAAASRPAKPFPVSLQPGLRATLEEVEAAVAAGTVPLHDARSAEQFAGKAKSPQARVGGTLPGAVNLELGKFYDAAAKRFPSGEAIREMAGKAGLSLEGGPITFCNTGHQAAITWFALSEVAGVPGVRLYDGSMSEWTADPARPLMNEG